jgi:putative colanic acid biosynthesis glycosyltransferase
MAEQTAPQEKALPLVSIVVAVRNAEKNIERTLESIIAQDYAQKEIVIIDGASTDGTLDVISKYKEHIGCLVSEPDRSIAEAYNKGIVRAHGAWIYFLNADDIFYTNHTLSDVFDARTYDGYEMVIGTVLAENGRVFKGRLTWKLLMRNRVHHQAIFYRAELLRKIPYNTQYKRYGHDYEHNLLMWKRRTKVFYFQTHVALWATGGISDTAKWKDYKEEFKMRRNVIGAFWSLPFGIFTVIRFVLKWTIMKRV